MEKKPRNFDKDLSPDIDIDIPSHKKEVVFNKTRDYMESIGGSLVRVGTYKTETTKSAIQTACRGMGISSDIALYLSTKACI